jgi:HPt (histidine-containing phosphotransfer) domain-containing protein
VKLPTERVWTLAETVIDAKAAGEAFAQRDFNEARFRAHLLAGKASGLGFNRLALAAADLEALLGPPDSVPLQGYGASMLRVAAEVETAQAGP